MSSIAEYLPAAGFVALPLIGGFLSGRSSSDPNNMRGWYENLNFPPFRPPNWLFPPVWTAIYTCMGASSYLIWREGGFEEQALPLAVYGGQLLLNLAWTPIFFGKHRIGLVSLGNTLACTCTLVWSDSTLVKSSNKDKHLLLTSWKEHLLKEMP